MWKEVIDLYEVLPQHLPGGTVENHQRSQSEYLVSGHRFEPIHVMFKGTIEEFA
jgi:hypothetical protein